MKSFVMRALLPGLLSVAALSPASAQQQATGAGASFPAPLYAKWAADYHRATGVKINYQSVGSSAGLRQIEARTVDFGASDAPLTDDELAAKGLVQFPTVVGGVIPVVNIAGVAPGALKLSGPVLGDIYLGKVTRWNDPAITALNPDLKLPDAAIAPVRRADGSGTTNAFTNYLSQVNPEWKAQVGEGTAVNWPTGAGGKGNEGVAAFVGRLPNSVGYVEYAYVKQNKMSYVQLQNADGRFVSPGDVSFKAAAAGADWAKSFYQVLNNKPGADAWPITTATYILMHAGQDKPENARTVLKFFDWAYAHGDTAAAELDYVPMPAAVKTLVRERAFGAILDAEGKRIADQ
ncbi:MAG TPA: phosphate ABC transporter substrate-binding protein PstS [Ottowia sp.]|uniref:phosphate ABC transporter substrate-binding protein PstS n=1 Tax=Ottowia sp. TaxID=1898956 RepID=UPI002BE4B3F0|nr:phosphate ABC transporter substrate-binding protein PstS [Ottowia sp.]HMN21071.1 phosphate ABC transporter substrate-binding protein PstS [Ottowia sp.]